jgi:5'-nucleotidase
MKYTYCFALAMLTLVPPASAQSPDPVELRTLAINDFHGYFHPPPGIRIADPADKAKKITVPAGGAEHMASLVRELREGRKNIPSSRPAI